MFCRLSGNNIGDAYVAAIANAIAVNASMTVLRLDYNKIGDAGAAAIAKAIEDNASLKLETLFVDDAILGNPQLVAACRAKGVKLQ